MERNFFKNCSILSSLHVKVSNDILRLFYLYGKNDKNVIESCREFNILYPDLVQMDNGKFRRTKNNFVVSHKYFSIFLHKSKSLHVWWGNWFRHFQKLIRNRRRSIKFMPTILQGFKLFCLMAHNNLSLYVRHFWCESKRMPIFWKKSFGQMSKNVSVKKFITEENPY